MHSYFYELLLNFQDLLLLTHVTKNVMSVGHFCKFKTTSDEGIFLRNISYVCYKLIQRFRVTGLFTGQYTTDYYGTFTDII